MVAKKIGDYLRHKLTLEALVAWAEFAMQEGDFEAKHAETLASVIGRLGFADVEDFALTWDDCEKMLAELGYSAHVEIVAA